MSSFTISKATVIVITGQIPVGIQDDASAIVYDYHSDTAWEDIEIQSRELSGNANV